MFKLFFDRTRFFCASVWLDFRGLLGALGLGRAVEREWCACSHLCLVLSVLLAVISEVDYDIISKLLVHLGRQEVPIVPRHAVEYGDGTIVEWMYVRFEVHRAGLCCHLFLVEELAVSGQFEDAVVAGDIVEAVRQNLVKVPSGMLRYGIDEVSGGRIVIRVFPSRVLVAPSSSPLSIGQKVEAYIVEANRAASFHRRELLDEKALVPCVVLVCSRWCVAPGLNFGTPMTLSRRRF